ncbi:MAG TPA: outer membrane beta-barrel protein [bacterium]|jgi:hypothetical protein
MDARRTTVLLAIALLLAGTALARTQDGDKEVGLAGSFGSAQDDGSPTTDKQNTIAGFIGYFVTDELEIGYGAAFTSAETVDDKDNVIASSAAQFHNFFLDYYVYMNRDDTAALYFGPSLGVAGLVSDSENVHAEGRGVTGAAHVGLKYFVTEDTSLYVNLERRRSVFGLTVTTPLFTGSAEGSRRETKLLFGMSYFFGSGGS